MQKLIWRIKFTALATLAIDYDPMWWRLSDTLYKTINGKPVKPSEQLSEYLNASY